MTLTTDASVIKQDLTQEEIERASSYLSATRDALIEAVSGLSDAQWEFKPTADCWSSAEIVEHVGLVEDRIHVLIGKLGDAPETPADLVAAEVEDTILRDVPKSPTKVMAPPFLLPTNRWSGPEALQHFLQSREETRRLLRSAPVLRGHVLPHPIFGPWDGYQWILACGAHCARHTGQIQGVKANFHS